jgi:excinuclease UvrABC helicase subunit UvrB
MLDHAQNLEFEEAAAMRDQLAQIKRENLIG